MASFRVVIHRDDLLARECRRMARSDAAFGKTVLQAALEAEMTAAAAKSVSAAGALSG